MLDDCAILGAYQSPHQARLLQRGATGKGKGFVLWCVQDINNQDAEVRNCDPWESNLDFDNSTSRVNKGWAKIWQLHCVRLVVKPLKHLEGRDQPILIRLHHKHIHYRLAAILTPFIASLYLLQRVALQFFNSIPTLMPLNLLSSLIQPAFC